MINPKIDTLITLAKYENFTKTAEILNLTQPAVTQHIKSLEDEYNIKIFIKNGRDLVITNQGKILLKYFQRIKSLENSLDNALDDYKNNRYHLDIGITPTASEFILPIIYKYIQKKYPNASINFHIHVLDELTQFLKSYSLDFCILDKKYNRKKFKSEMIYDDSLVFICSNDHINKENIQSLEDIKSEKLILRHEKSQTRIQFEEYLDLHQETISNFNIALEIESINLIKQLIKQDYGISLLPYSICKEEIENHSLYLLNIKNFKIKRDTYLIYNQDNENLPLIADLIDYLKRKI